MDIYPEMAAGEEDVTGENSVAREQAGEARSEGKGGKMVLSGGQVNLQRDNGRFLLSGGGARVNAIGRHLKHFGNNRRMNRLDSSDNAGSRHGTENGVDTTGAFDEEETRGMPRNQDEQRMAFEGEAKFLDGYPKVIKNTHKHIHGFGVTTNLEDMPRYSSYDLGFHTQLQTDRSQSEIQRPGSLLEEDRTSKGAPEDSLSFTGKPNSLVEDDGKPEHRSMRGNGKLNFSHLLTSLNTEHVHAQGLQLEVFKCIQINSVVSFITIHIKVFFSVHVFLSFETIRR